MNSDQRIRVLYIEDNHDSFEMVKVMLGLANIEVSAASSVGEAIARARAERFDLYLLDSGLPDGNGLSLCRTLRATFPSIPVVFYSGHARPEEIKMGMEAGAHGYIIKPHSDKLADTILRLLETQKENTSGRASLPVFTAVA